MTLIKSCVRDSVAHMLFHDVGQDGRVQRRRKELKSVAAIININNMHVFQVVYTCCNI